jgi:serine/threonine protein kinase
MHEQSKVHRDMKAANVLLGYHHSLESYQALIADFDLAVDFDLAFSSEFPHSDVSDDDSYGIKIKAMGSPYQLSPEVLRAQHKNGTGYISKEDAKAQDLWAAACILYRMICGHLPFAPGAMTGNIPPEESKTDRNFWQTPLGVKLQYDEITKFWHMEKLSDCKTKDDKDVFLNKADFGLETFQFLFWQPLLQANVDHKLLKFFRDVFALDPHQRLDSFHKIASHSSYMKSHFRNIWMSRLRELIDSLNTES